MKKYLHFFLSSLFTKQNSLFAICFLFVFAKSIAQVPAISSFSPTSGAVGSSVTINGTGFSGTPANNIVYFGAVRATVNTATATSLSVTVPVGASYQPISVTTNNFTAYALKPFDVTFNGGGNSFTDYDFSTLFKYPHPNTSFPKFIKTADFDGDGKTDILSVEETDIKFLINASTTNNFSFPNQSYEIIPPNVSQIVDIAIADIDGDGKLDVIVSYNLQNISVYRNTSTSGNISFDAKVDFVVTSLLNTGGIAVGDIDGDGKPDLVVSSTSSNGAITNDGTISTLHNTSTPGTISFDTHFDYTYTNINPQYPSLTDIDGDGKIDLVFPNNYHFLPQGFTSFMVLLNTSSSGSISFASAVEINSSGQFYKFLTADFDGDGKTDLVGYGHTNNISILRNASTIGNVSFDAKFDIAVNSNSNHFDIADMDGDGKPDIIATNAPLNHTSSVSLFRNTSSSGSLSFDAEYDYIKDAINNAPGFVTIADFDGDGKPDIAAPNGYNHYFMRNQIGETTIWTGANNTNWSLAGNWTNGVPSAMSTVVIPGVMNGRNPSTPLIGTTAINNLYIKHANFPNGLLNVVNKVQIAGTIMADGVLSGAGYGTLEFNGKNEQTLSFNGSADINNFILNNSEGAILTGRLNIYTALTPTLGNLFITNIAGLVTLIANPNGLSAKINQGSSSGYITGNVKVQQYLYAKRGWRILGNPFNFAIPLSNLADSSGINLNNNGTTTAYSFDGTQLSPSNPWVPAGYSWNSKSGLLLFIRGLAGEGLPNNGSIQPYNPSPVILSYTGQVNNGDQPAINLNYDAVNANNQWNLIANPYPCPISLKKVANLYGNANINQSIYYFSPNKLGGNAYSANGDYNFITLGAMDFVVPPFSSVFVQAQAAGQSITIQEASKTTGYPVTTLFGMDDSKLVELKLSDINDNFIDRLQFRLDANAKKTSQDHWDLPKMTQTNNNCIYTLSSDKVRMAIDSRSDLLMMDTITLGIKTSTLQKYKFDVAAYSIPNDKQLFLKDKYLQNEILLDSTTSYVFDVNSDSLSLGDKRFEMILKSKSTATVANDPSVTPIFISPNPTSDFINVPVKDNNPTSIRLLNTEGKVIRSVNVSKAGITKIPISDISKGLFIVEIISDKYTQSCKIIKQ